LTDVERATRVFEDILGQATATRPGATDGGGVARGSSGRDGTLRSRTRHRLTRAGGALLAKLTVREHGNEGGPARGRFSSECAKVAR
jgi:hypothetical protein